MRGKYSFRGWALLRQEVLLRVLTGEVSQHRCQRNSEEDQSDGETFPGASVLAPFVDVKT